MSRAGEIAGTAWNILKTGTLAASDGMIDLSLMRKGTRPKAGTRTAWPRGMRERLGREQRGLCIYCCGRLPLGASHIDHVTPVIQGGSNERENL